MAQQEDFDVTYWRKTYEEAVLEEDAVVFDRFGYQDAWALGSEMVTQAYALRHPVAIAVNFGEQRVFHAALPGSTATNDDWLARKFRAVAKHNCSSWALGCLHRAQEFDYYTEGGYDRAQIAVAGGAVPLRVNGSLIGVVGVSGLEQFADHRFVIDALSAYRAKT